MLQNLTKGKMVVWVVLLFALVFGIFGYFENYKLKKLMNKNDPLDLEELRLNFDNKDGSIGLKDWIYKIRRT